MSSIRLFLVIAVFTIETILCLRVGNCMSKTKMVGQYYCSDLNNIIYGPNSLQFRPNDFANNIQYLSVVISLYILQ